MGLLNKLKNLILEDEEEEEDILLEEENKEVYQEPKDVLPKVMRDTIKEEEETKISDFKPLKGTEFLSSSDVSKENENKTENNNSKKFAFPIDFHDEVVPSRTMNNINNTNKNDEFKNTDYSKKKVEQLYSKKEQVKEKPKFKPTPVISPVYGILDKNYKKDEVRERLEENNDMKRPSKKVDFETVRRKAFGNLVDDIKDNMVCENCELYKEVKRISSISQDDLLYDLLGDDDSKKKKTSDVTIEKAYDDYKDFGVLYENSREKETPTIINNTSIDTINITKDNDIEIEHNHLDDKSDTPSDAKGEENTPLNKTDKNEEKVDSEFFDLIDSMYKERIDE